MEEGRGGKERGKRGRRGKEGWRGDWREGRR